MFESMLLQNDFAICTAVNNLFQSKKGFNSDTYFKNHLKEAWIN